MSTRFAVTLSLAGLAIGVISPNVSAAQKTPGTNNRDTTVQVSKEVEKISPTQVYSNYCKALAKGDAETFFACVTHSYGESYIFGMAFALGLEGDSSRHFDELAAQKALKAAGGQLTDENRHAIYAAGVRDKNALFKEYTSRFANEVKNETAEALQDVTIKGDRARGVVTRLLPNGAPARTPGAGKVRIATPVHFGRTEFGWRIDKPTPEEVSHELEILRSRSTPDYGPIDPAKPEAGKPKAVAPGDRTPIP